VNRPEVVGAAEVVQAGSGQSARYSADTAAPAAGGGGGAVGESLHDGAAVAVNLGGGAAGHPAPTGLQNGCDSVGER